MGIKLSHFCQTDRLKKKKRYLIVLMCINIIINEADHLLSCLMVICLSLNCLFISFAHICLFYWTVRTLCKLRKLAFCHTCCKSILDFTAITKWHTNWEFELFFYIYRTYSFDFNLLHAHNQREFKNEQERVPVLQFDTSLIQMPSNSERYGSGIHFW